MIRDVFRRQGTPLWGLNNPSVPLYQALTGTYGAPSDSGVIVNEATALRITIVFACVNLIAETIASLPLKTYSGAGANKVEVHLPSEAYIWDAPNPEQTRQSFWETICAAILLHGNAYINTARDGLGGIAELYPVHPDSVRIDRDPKTGVKTFVNLRTNDAYGAQQIVHIPGFGTDGLYGLSVIGQARQAMGLSLAAESFGARLFGSGSLLQGLIKTGADLSDKPEVAEAIKKRWKELYTGLNKAWDIGVLDNGGEFVPLTIPPQDAQFIELRNYQAASLAGLFRVPPHLVGLGEKSTTWGTGIEQQNIQFTQYRLRPLATRIEQTITRDLLPVKPRYARFDDRALLRGDTSARIAYYSAGRRDGWLNVDEIREKEELGPLPDGQGQTYLETPTGASPNPTDTPPEPTMNPDDTGMASLPLVAAHELEAPNGVAR